MSKPSPVSPAAHTLHLFIKTLLKRPWLLAGTLMLGPAFVLQNIISPLFIAQAIGQLVSHHAVEPTTLWYAGLTLFSGILLNFIAARYCEVKLNVRGIRDIHQACMEQLIRQDYAFFADHFAGSLVTQAVRMAKSFELFTYTVFIEVWGLLAGVIVAFGVMMYYNLAIGLSTLVIWLGSIALVAWMAMRRMPIRRRAVAKETQQTGELADIVTNTIAMKTFAAETTETVRYDRTNQERSRLYMKSWETASNNGTIIQLLSGALQMIVLVGGVWAITAGSLSVATFLLFQVYILRIIDSVQRASLAVRQFEGIFGDTHEMARLFTRIPAIQDPSKPQPSRIASGAIELQDVTFSYQDHKTGSHHQALLEHFNLTIAPGEHVGLVGPSGGGKTTITKLLLRFADVQSGAVLIDGQDLRHLKQTDLHRAISYVPQEPLLFHRSITENIGYGDPAADHTAIVQAARRAHAHDFIKTLPHGYDTLVGERGIKLSGGQRQRIALARAMLKQAPVLILDEATSALDSQSERYIQQSLWELMEGRTTIVIAHRLSTIQKLDRIIVLDAGRIIEQGSHAELLGHGGLYAKLWSHQSGGFITESNED